MIPEACVNITYSIVSAKRDAFRDASSICKTRVTSVTVMDMPYRSLWVSRRLTIGWLINLLTFFAQHIKLKHNRWLKAAVSIVVTSS